MKMQDNRQKRNKDNSFLVFVRHHQSFVLAGAV